MEFWSCFINPFQEKQLIRNDTTGEEYRVDLNDVPDTLFKLHNEKGLKTVWVDGLHADAYDIIWKYRNAHPEDSVTFTIG